MADRLAELGKPIDRERSCRRAMTGKSLGRPMVAKALVKAGHVADARQAFDQLIGEGKPAFVERSGPGRPPRSSRIIARAGGIASLAHPGLLKRDDLIPGMVDAGPRGAGGISQRPRSASTTEHYLALAERHGILVSGGSDYHGEKERRRAAFGTVGLPPDLFERLSTRAARAKQRRSDGGGAPDGDIRIGRRHRLRDLPWIDRPPATRRSRGTSPSASSAR